MTRLGLKQKLTTTQLLFRYSSVQLVQEKKPGKIPYSIDDEDDDDDQCKSAHTA